MARADTREKQSGRASASGGERVARGTPSSAARRCEMKALTQGRADPVEMTGGLNSTALGKKKIIIKKSSENTIIDL